jgi:hypothetical protein
MATPPTRLVWVDQPTPYELSPEELAEKGVDRDLVVGIYAQGGNWTRKPRVKKGKDGQVVYDDDGVVQYEDEGVGEFFTVYQFVGRPDRETRRIMNELGDREVDRRAQTPGLDQDDITV